VCVHGREEGGKDFDMSETASVIIEYPIGARDDPQGKEGLAHFTEHCLLKARIGGKNLITICREEGAVVNAKTSMNYITIEIKIINPGLTKLLSVFSGFYPDIQESMELTPEYLLGEKKTVLQEMKTKSSAKTGNRILGTEASLEQLSGDDVWHMLSLVLCSKIKVIVSNVIANELEAVSGMIKSIFLNYDKAFNGNQTTITPEKKSDIVILKNVSDHRFCLSIVASGLSSKFLVISIDVIAEVRNYLKGISDLLLRYLCVYNKSLRIQTNIEAGCLNVLMIGEEDGILSAWELMLHMKAEEVIKAYQERSPAGKHILEDIHDRLVHQRKEDGSSAREELFEALTYFCGFNNLKASLITNIQNESKIWGSLPKSTGALKAQSDRRYDLSKLGEFHPKQEYVELWETPNYFSKEKYVSHILWAMLEGTTGELYKKLVLQEKLCYSFAFYPRELLDFGYSVLYIKLDNRTPGYLFQGIFRRLMKEMGDSLDENSLELAKNKLISAKKGRRNEVEEYVNLAMINLSGKGGAMDYCEEIRKVTLDDLYQYINSMILGKSRIIT
jgi:predicted Zn-dependent peptidase